MFEESDSYSDDNLVLYRGRNEPLVVEEYKRESKTNGEIEVNNIIMLKTFMSKCR